MGVPLRSAIAANSQVPHEYATHPRLSPRAWRSRCQLGCSASSWSQSSPARWPVSTATQVSSERIRDFPAGMLCYRRSASIAGSFPFSVWVILPIALSGFLQQCCWSSAARTSNVRALIYFDEYVAELPAQTLFRTTNCRRCALTPGSRPAGYAGRERKRRSKRQNPGARAARTSTRVPISVDCDPSRSCLLARLGARIARQLQVGRHLAVRGARVLQAASPCGLNLSI